MNKNKKTLIIASLIVAFSANTAVALSWDSVKSKLSKKENVSVKKEQVVNSKAVKKTKPKKEKYDDTLIKAKTDKNMPSVKILINDSKKVDKQEDKDLKIVKKHFTKIALLV